MTFDEIPRFLDFYEVPKIIHEAIDEQLYNYLDSNFKEPSPGFSIADGSALKNAEENKNSTIFLQRVTKQYKLDYFLCENIKIILPLLLGQLKTNNLKFETYLPLYSHSTDFLNNRFLSVPFGNYIIEVNGFNYKYIYIELGRGLFLVFETYDISELLFKTINIIFSNIVAQQYTNIEEKQQLIESLWWLLKSDSIINIDVIKHTPMFNFESFTHYKKALMPDIDFDVLLKNKSISF